VKPKSNAKTTAKSAAFRIDEGPQIINASVLGRIGIESQEIISAAWCLAVSVLASRICLFISYSN